MIDLNLHLISIERLMELMTKHEIDEVSVDFVNLKKSKHKPVRTTDITYAPVPPPSTPSNEPWLDIPEKDIDAFTITGKVK